MEQMKSADRVMEEELENCFWREERYGLMESLWNEEIFQEIQKWLYERIETSNIEYGYETWSFITQ